MDTDDSEFLRLYVEERLPGREVAARMGITLDRVYAMKRRLGVPTVPKWARRDLPSLDETPLRSVLLGSMLGDGAISPNKDSLGGFSFMEGHSIAQRGYLEWKRSIWGKLEEGGWAGSMSEESRGVLMAHPKQPDRLFQAQPRCSFTTAVHGALRPWWEVFYRNADIGAGGQRLKKYRAEDVVELVGGLGGLDDVALAVWYADDGHGGYWPNFCVGPRNREEAGRLLSLWGFEPTVTAGGVTLRGREQASEFLQRVGPVFQSFPDLKYKLDDLGYRNTQPCGDGSYTRRVQQRRAARVLRLTAREAEALKLGKKGKAPSEVAELFGYSKVTVKALFERSGVPVVRKRKPIPPELVQRVEAGEAVSVLAKEYGWGPKALGDRLDAMGVSRRGRGHAVGTLRPKSGMDTPEELKQLLVESGGAVMPVVKRLGVSHGTVLKRIRRWGLEEFVVKHTRSGRPPVVLVRAEVEALFASGLTYHQVAKRCGVAWGTLHMRLKEWSSG